jgi:hypothetical protein
MAAAPEDRYSSASELARALRRAWLLVLVRRLLPAAAAVVLLLGAAAWLRPRGASPTPAAVIPAASTPDAAPIEAEITVTHYKDRGADNPPEPVGVVSERTIRSDPPRLNDLLRVRVSLSRPAYGYLIALNPNGKDELCRTAGGRSSDARWREFDFPEDPKDYFGLTDGAGVQAFVLVASDRPLPEYDAWKSQVPSGLSWSPPDGDALWTDGDPPPADPSRRRGQLRGEIIRRRAAPDGLVGLCDRLRKSPGVAAVRAVAFPVKRDREIEK